METEQILRRGGLICAAIVLLGNAFAMPAHAADSEVEQLKRELAEQRRLIDKLLAGQEQKSVPPFVVPSAKAGEGAPQTNVTFYGVADVGIASMDSGKGRKTYVNGGGGASASRLGLKVERSFGDALKAIALAEGGVHFDTGSVGGGAVTPGIDQTASSSGAPGTGGQIFARQIYAGVDGTFGKLTFGRQYAGSYLAGAAVGTAFADGLYANPISYLPVIGGMPTRVNNSVVYSSPRLNGLSTVVMLTSGSENNVNTSVPVTSTTKTTDEAGRGWDVALFYNAGSFNAAASTWRLKNSSWATPATGPTETDLATKRGWQVAANYDFGFVKVFGDYVSGKVEGGNYENVTKTLSDAAGWALGVVVPVAKHTFIARYSMINDDSLLDQDARIYGISYLYELYKDTKLYASWGKVDNSSTAVYSAVDGGSLVGKVTEPGKSPSGVAVGVNVAF